MGSRTATLCTLLVIVLGLRAAWTVLERRARIPEKWLRPPIDANAETLLAFGAQIPLACADISDLELIPGVSDQLASELIQKRSIILVHAQKSTPEEALQLARGVGERTATNLSFLLSLEDACYQGETYEPFSKLRSQRLSD